MIIGVFLQGDDDAIDVVLSATVAVDGMLGTAEKA